MNNDRVRRHAGRPLECLFVGFGLIFGFPFCFGVLPLINVSFQDRRYPMEDAVADTETTRKKMRLEDLGHELLPGIPNYVTLEVIAPMLSWRDFGVLSSVSPDWELAIQGHLVHDARVRHHSTKTHVVFVNCVFKGQCFHDETDTLDLGSKIDGCTHALPPSPGLRTGIPYGCQCVPLDEKCFRGQCFDDDIHTLGLYSKIDDDMHELQELPPIPGLRTGIPYGCQCVSLDGKIYALGGAKTKSRDSPGCSEVYVLDLAGQRQWQQGWQQRARMNEPRHTFGSGVIDGKIYVFGGMSRGKPVRGSEVYDPKINAWSPITGMPHLRSGHRVSTRGDELFVHGGYYFDAAVMDGAEYEMIDGDESWNEWNADRIWYIRKDALSLDVYNPVKDEWRSIEGFTTDERYGVFEAMGSFLILNKQGVFCYHEETNEWSFEQETSFTEFGPMDTVEEPEIVTVVVDGELLALVQWENEEISRHGLALLQGELLFWCGYDIEWETIKECCLVGIDDTRDLCHAFQSSPILCPIEL